MVFAARRASLFLAARTRAMAGAGELLAIEKHRVRHPFAGKGDSLAYTAGELLTWPDVTFCAPLWMKLSRIFARQVPN